MTYRAVVEAGKLADKQLEPLRKALMEKDRWHIEACRMMDLKKECKSLNDPNAFIHFLADQLRHAYRTGGNEVRYAIRNALEID